MTRNQGILVGILGGAAVMAAAVGIYVVMMMPQGPTNTNVNVNVPTNVNENANANVNVPAPIDKSDLIRVFEPLANATISNPVRIRGEARGNWYFEASFPITIEDANGTVISQGAYATAQGEWMTTNFVPFDVTISYSQPTTATGKIILHKDNPSGLPENDDSLEIPVTFATYTQPSPVVKNGCVVSGCSSEICADDEMVSACIYKEEFACYRSATCERQSNGQCGWTETGALNACIANAQNN